MGPSSNGRWRCIDSGIADPAYTMAVDEALLLNRIKTSGDDQLPEATLHLYSRDPPAVSLGYFQKVYDEIRVDTCEQMGVRILRRGSGGGAIYTDSNQLIYGLVISGDKMGTIQDSFKYISRGVVETLRLYGLNAEMSGLNDITVNGQKISGCAQTRKKNYILQHGTFLINFDIDKVSEILTPSSLKLIDKNAEDLAGRMTNLTKLLGFTPGHEEFKRKIVLGFERAFNVRIEPGKLTEEENRLVEELLARKYHNNEWNFRR